MKKRLMVAAPAAAIASLVLPGMTSIASLCYWAVGFALAFGGLGEIAGTHGFFLSPAAFMFFQFVFCAVSLAIVWGATLERIKFSAYIKGLSA